MLRRFLPARFKAWLTGEFRSLLRDHLPEVLPQALPYQEHFLPHHPEAQCYLIPKTPERAELHEASPLPVPPRPLWLGYGQTTEEYLASGKYDVQTLSGLLGQSGAPLEAAGRILELGCAAGRILRWLADLTPVCEVWGADINATAILWCQQHLSPPFHFVTNTIWPHLPFEDRSFGVVYAGSVFTHVDDLAHSWFLELRRVLRPGGRLYFTIHDRNTVALLEDREQDSPLARVVRGFPEYAEYSRAEFGMFTLGRSAQAQVFYDVEFLCRRLEPFFRLRSIVEEAYGYQTAVLLERV